MLGRVNKQARDLKGDQVSSNIDARQGQGLHRLTVIFDASPEHCKAQSFAIVHVSLARIVLHNRAH